jgi:hypothetical protein
MKLTPEQIKERLSKIGAALKGLSPRSTQYKRLMVEIDNLMETKEAPRNAILEEEWEKNRQ